MRRIIRLILLLSVFLGGYYLGRRPGSPDIFAWAQGVYLRVTDTSSDIAARAKDEDTSLPEAVFSSLLEPSEEADKSPDRSDRSR